MLLDIDLTSGDLQRTPPQRIPTIQAPRIPPSTTSEPNNPVNFTKTKKKRIWPRILLFTLVAIALGGIGYFYHKSSQISKEVGFKFDIGNVITTKKPELKKDSSGKHTNVLLVGVDSRESNFISNTDTILIASYNHETKDITMVSIPRDFYVVIDPKTKWYGRINTIYPNAESKKEGEGFPALLNTIKDFTNLEIQYYAMVDFKAFVEIVDQLGGLSINVENSFVDNAYPNGNKYKIIKFTAGPQEMDGETALEYSRSRHSLQNNEGSDYARARRQQKVIAAIQEKIAQSDTLRDPKAIMGIFSSLVNNIKISEFTITDIQAGLDILDEFKTSNGKTNSFVLDPNAGDGTLIEVKTMESGAFAIGPVEGFGIYKRIHQYVNVITTNPRLYSEDPTIFIYDIGMGAVAINTLVKQMRTDFPYINFVISYPLYLGKEGNYIYSNEEGHTESISQFSKYLETDKNSAPDFLEPKLSQTGVIMLLGVKPTPQQNNESGI